MANLGSGTTSTAYQHQSSNLVNKIRIELENLNALSFPEYSIFRVPDPLRKLNPEAYTPQFISIGPFHYGNQTLQTLEKYKVRYLKDFINRSWVNLENLVQIIEDSEESLRHCYAEISPLSQDDFVTMILTDASFIIEFFLRNWRTEWTSDDNKLFKPWLFDRIRLDFLLIENQLPFFIIEQLFDLAFPSTSNPTVPSFIDLTFEYFSLFNSQRLPSNPKPEIKHFVDLLRKFYLPPSQNIQNRRRRAEHMYSITQLSHKGLKFDVNCESTCLCDIRYDAKERKLKIPPFKLSGYTELCAGNIIALEHCLYPNEEYVTDYFILLNFLVQSEADVVLLGEKGIILNELGNNDATFINRLSASSTCSRMSSEYYELCDQLVEFYQKPFHGWKATLMRDYLSTPMKAAATFTAVLLLILTLIQTVCSILQVLQVK